MSNRKTRRPPAPPAADGPQRMAEAQRILYAACDAHGWRAKSFAGALRALAASECVAASDLGAIAEAIGDHIEGLAEAVDKAGALLVEAPA